jgi:hypothetical protein
MGYVVHSDSIVNLGLVSISNIKIHTGHTYLFLENKYLIKGIKKMFPHKILTFHSWENIYCKFTCPIEIWIT